MGPMPPEWGALVLITSVLHAQGEAGAKHGVSTVGLENPKLFLAGGDTRPSFPFRTPVESVRPGQDTFWGSGLGPQPGVLFVQGSL